MIKSLDRLDLKILQELQHNGRISNIALAERIGLSATPCQERVKRLERDGFITGYHARLSPRHLQQDFITFMTVNLERTGEGVFHRFARDIQALDEVVECHMVGGGFDYILKIRSASMQDFRQFMADKLANLPGIAQTHSYFVMEAVKDDETLRVIAASE